MFNDRGPDVSKHQLEIDWNKVASQVGYAMIRVGYRTYGSGKIYLDSYFGRNIQGAIKNNIPYGFYFFSQALSENEAVEEAEFMLEHTKDYKPQLPYCFDYEGFNKPKYRVYNTTKAERTAYQKAFNDVVRLHGGKVMTYGSSGLIRSKFDLSAEDIPIWCARYAGGYDKVIDDVGYFPNLGEYSDRIVMWQYTSVGELDGIKGNVDMNIMVKDIIEEGGITTPIEDDLKGIQKFYKGIDNERMLSKNFKTKEFMCPCKRCNSYLVDVDFVQVLQKVRDWAKSWVRVNSGYRCPEHNAEVGGSPTSNHKTGIAFDIHVNGKTPLEVAQFLESINVNGIIKYDTFVHMDNISYKRYKVNKGGKFVSVETFTEKESNPYNEPNQGSVQKAPIPDEDIMWSQWTLNKLGFYREEVNGLFDEATEMAVRSYQMERGLEVDGRIGPQTRSSLKEDY